MRSTRDNVLAMATRHRPLEPVQVDRHRDFDVAAVGHVQRAIECCGAVEGDALLIEPGEPVRVMRVGDLLAWLRDNALDKLALQVERTHVPNGECIALVVGDEDARIRTVKLVPAALPRPFCTALRAPR